MGVTWKYCMFRAWFAITSLSDVTLLRCNGQQEEQPEPQPLPSEEPEQGPGRRGREGDEVSQAGPGKAFPVARGFERSEQDPKGGKSKLTNKSSRLGASESSGSPRRARVRKTVPRRYGVR